MLTRPALAVAAAVLAAAPSPAQEKKPGRLRDFPFWTAPKTPHARPFVPGLQATLGLTPEQAERIEAACRDTVDKPENRGKNSPTAAAAQEELHRRVGEILTTDQKKLIEKTNDAYAEAVAEVGEEFGPLYGAVKGDAEATAKLREQQREAVAETFAKKLDPILTPEQKKALDAAAAAETNKKKVKPNE